MTPLYITEPSFAQLAQFYVALPYLPRADIEEALTLLLNWVFDPKLADKDMAKAKEWNHTDHSVWHLEWLTQTSMSGV